MKSREGVIRLKKFQVDEKRRQVAQIEKMMADFQEMVDVLDAQILDEQRRAGIDDISHYAYPTYAKAAKQRRDNLIKSIEDLNLQLDKARENLAEAFEELKKMDILEERSQREMASQLLDYEQEQMDEIASQMHYRSS